MYTILENVRIVISLLKKHNIRKFVISPGGSNVPLVQGLQSDPFFTCYSVVDERSAMYFAIGLYLESGEIIGTSCTSAQATRNYVPGLTEAFYKHIPILAITMSKHPRFWGQEYMQCPVQTSLPVDTVKKTYNVPIIRDENNRILCIRTINEAILELSHNGLGPVQLNIEELDNETWLFDENAKLPDVRSIKRINYSSQIDSKELDCKKILIVIGEHRPFTDTEYKALEIFCESHDVFVYADNLSNYKGKYAINVNLATNNMPQALFDEFYCPDVVVTLGGVTGDYPIFFKLSNATERLFELWRVNVDGNVVDTYNKLTRVYQMPIEEFCASFQNKTVIKHSYFMKWQDLHKTMNFDLDLPFSNIYAAQQLSKLIPKDSIMHYAINNSLRVWSMFELDKSIQSYSTVAAFGIDGCMSTMIGQSVITEKKSFLITGDLAFFYDMNALGIRHIKNNVRILLVNNNGGMEFKFGNLQEKTDISPYIAADGHFKNAKGWAETCGFTYMSASNKGEFNSKVNIFVNDSERPILFEIFTTTTDEKSGNVIMRELNTISSFSVLRVNKLNNAVKGLKNFFKK